MQGVWKVWWVWVVQGEHWYDNSNPIFRQNPVGAKNKFSTFQDFRHFLVCRLSINDYDRFWILLWLWQDGIDPICEGVKIKDVRSLSVGLMPVNLIIEIKHEKVEEKQGHDWRLRWHPIMPDQQIYLMLMLMLRLRKRIRNKKMSIQNWKRRYKICMDLLHNYKKSYIF